MNKHMTTERAIQMIDEYLLEPNNIDKAWVEVLELCKAALMENLCRTDHKTIKGLVAHFEKAQACRECPLQDDGDCCVTLLEGAYKLINRQEAEIERLEAARKVAAYGFNSMEAIYKTKCKELEVVKDEAVNEFAERLPECIPNINGVTTMTCVNRAISNLGKCKKFSDDKTTSYCVDGPCEYEKLSNYDRIRNMSVDEMAAFCARNFGCKNCDARELCRQINSGDCILNCFDNVKQWLESEGTD